MSSETNTYRIQTKEIKTQNPKVDINILLNKVRHERKKKQKKNLLFLSIIGSVIVVKFLIASF